MKSKMKSTSNGTASTLFTSSAAILRQTTLPFRQTAEKRLRELALRIVGKCVHVDEGYHRFVRRANIMYFRLCVSSSLSVYCRSLFHIHHCIIHVLTHNVGLNHPKFRVSSCPPCSRGSRSAPM
jgi:hypothetical protein